MTADVSELMYMNETVTGLQIWTLTFFFSNLWSLIYF
jgi:hypothetical protein